MNSFTLYVLAFKEGPYADGEHFVSAGVRRSDVGSVNNRATPIVAFGEA